MLDMYHDAIIAAVKIFGEKYDPTVEYALFLTSPGGVAGMSRTWSSVVVDTVVPSTILGLLILLVAHFCASTILFGSRAKWVFTKIFSFQECATLLRDRDRGRKLGA
jgi:hypothetical protein